MYSTNLTAEQLLNELTVRYNTARKNKDFIVSVLGSLINALKSKEKSVQRQLTIEEVFEVIRKELKEKMEEIQSRLQAGRDVQLQAHEASLLKTYLPPEIEPSQALSYLQSKYAGFNEMQLKDKIMLAKTEYKPSTVSLDFGALTKLMKGN